MSQVIGVYSRLLMCPEVANKEAGTLPTDLTGKVLSLPFNTNSLSGSQNINDAATITGRRDASEPILGNHDSNGDIDVPLDVNAFGWWLAFAFGSPTTTHDESSGLYTHVFKPGKTQPFATIEKEAADQGVFLKTAGVKVNKMSFQFGGDNELTCKITCVGCKETIEKSTLGTATDVEMRRLNQFQAAGLKIGGKESAIITSLDLDIDFGLDTDGYAIGSNGYRTRLNEGIIKPSGKMEAFFDDTTLLTSALNNETSSIELPLIKGEESLTIKVPEIKFNYKSPDISGPAGLKQELDYSGFYSTNTDNTCVMFTLVNSTASYAFQG